VYKLTPSLKNSGVRGQKVSVIGRGVFEMWVFIVIAAIECVFFFQNYNAVLVFSPSPTTSWPG
jgi:hypothetical protein